MAKEFENKVLAVQGQLQLVLSGARAETANEVRKEMFRLVQTETD